jgi:hypothetical protein
MRAGERPLVRNPALGPALGFERFEHYRSPPPCQGRFLTTLAQAVPSFHPPELSYQTHSIALYFGTR